MSIMITEINKNEVIPFITNKYDLVKSDYKGFSFDFVIKWFFEDYLFNELKATSYITTTHSDIIKISYGKA